MFKLLSIYILFSFVPVLPYADTKRCDTVSVTVIGDVMMHSRQIECRQETFLEDLAPILREADFAVANMEFSLAGKPYTGYPAFSAPDTYAGYVASCGVDVFLMANNHVADKGPSGMKRTLEIYRSMSDSVKFTGCAENKDEYAATSPLILFRKGIKLALINFTYGSNYPLPQGYPSLNKFDKMRIRDEISAARKAGADFIVALPHWGTEYMRKHSAEQQEQAEWLINEGIDAIVGSHPHIIQDTATVKGAPVIYSTGNAISNMSAEGTRLGMAVTLRFTHDWISGRKQMLKPEITYIWCTLPGKLIPDSYATVIVDNWQKRRAEWIDPSDYDNMMRTLGSIRQ